MDFVLIFGFVFSGICALVGLIALVYYLVIYYQDYMAAYTRIKRIKNRCKKYVSKAEDKISKIEQNVRLNDNLEYLKKHNLLEEFFSKKDKKK